MLENIQNRSCAKKGMWFLHGCHKGKNVESMWITVDSPFGRDRRPVEDIIDVQIAED